ncbi:MAG: hypothetical protein U0V75_17595 [Ferruginibacter sp.]
MSITDFAIPALALAVILTEVFVDGKKIIENKSEGVEKENDSWKTKKKYILITIGIATFFCSIWSSWNSSDVSNKLQESQDSLLVSQHRVESSQKDLQIEQLKNSIAQKVMSDSQNSLINKLYVDDSTNSLNFITRLDRLKKSRDSLIRVHNVKPVLDILPNNLPIIKREYYSNKDALLVIVSQVIPNTVATNEYAQFKFIGIKGHDLIDLGITPFNSKENVYHPQKDGVFAVGINMNKDDYKGFDLYLCLKVDYTDLEGEKQNPLVRIFPITLEYDKRFRPEFGITYDRLLAYLQSVNFL